MIRQLSKVFALLALVVVTGCQSPTAPKVEEVCEDPNAQNYKGKLPCVPKPVVQTEISFIDSNPKPGESLKKMVLENGTEGGPVSGDILEVTLQYVISAEHLAEASKRGRDVVIRTVLSTDGENNIPGGLTPITRVSSSGPSSREFKVKFYVVGVKSPTVNETTHIVADFFWAMPDNSATPEFFLRKSVSVRYVWKPNP